MKRIRELLITDPVIVARDGADVVIVARDDAAQLEAMTNSQLYRPKDDVFSPVAPLGVYGKFMPYIEAVDPPQPFVRATPT